MTAPVAPPGPMAAPRPPGGVLTAAWLFSGTAAFWLTAVIATLFAVPQYARHHADLAQSADAGSGAALLLIVAAVLAVPAMVASVLLAVLDARGRAAARVLTWILGGLAAVVAGTVLLTGLFTATAWHRWLMDTVAVLTLVLVVATVVLLSTPRAKAYFQEARAARQAAFRMAHAASYMALPPPYGWQGYPRHPGPPPQRPPVAPQYRPPGPPGGPGET